MGGLSIIRPEPIMNKYNIPAIVSQIPLITNVTANGFNELVFTLLN